MTFFSSRVIGRAPPALTGTAEVTMGTPSVQQDESPGGDASAHLDKVSATDAGETGTVALGETPSRRRGELR
jgi:hypothetical protein